jgi:hypothetical protein
MKLFRNKRTKQKESKVEHVGTYKDVQETILHDNHEVILLPNGKDIGVVNFERAIENQSIIIERAKSARTNEFYIEFISLKIQYLEFYLKIYWVSKHPNNKVFSESDQMFFGTLIKQCLEFGFDPKLGKTLFQFNKERRKAIHQFMMGATGEEELKLVCEKYSKLGNVVYNYVIDECGVLLADVSEIPNDVGSLVITRPKRY